MKYKIIGDSCCDISSAYKCYDKVEKIPLTLSLDGKEYIDDETFNQLEFIEHVAKSKDYARSACPSPERFMRAYEGDYDCVFVITLSANLSGCYSSAMAGVDMYRDEYPDDEKKIYVFNSCSASPGEGNIAEKIYELAEAGVTYEEIVEKVEAYTLEMKTYFVLETLEPLRKNGRLSNIKALMASVLNIKPVMSASDEGLIIQLEQVRGIERALKKMMDYIVKNTKDIEQKVLSIAHVNCIERAKWVKEELAKLARFKDIVITETAGVATLYANDGGIIVAV